MSHYSWEYCTVSYKTDSNLVRKRSWILTHSGTNGKVESDIFWLLGREKTTIIKGIAGFCTLILLCII